MLTLGVGRYRSKVEKAKERGAEIETRYGQVLMRNARPLYAERIEEWKEAVIAYPTPAR